MTPSLEISSLIHELQTAIQGDVLFDDASRALYAADASNYRQTPIGVIRPKNAEDVRAALKICRKYGAPVLSRGAGTSLAGQACNAAVIFDFQKYMNRILTIDPVKKTASVEPGVVLDDLNAALKSHGLMFGPDPATHSRCTLGGMIGNNSCGVHSVIAGKTSENVSSLKVLTYDGIEMTVGKVPEGKLETGGRRAEIYQGLKDISEKYSSYIRSRYPGIPRRVSGYSLDELLPEKGSNAARSLVGTEGTCVIILEAELQLIQNFPHRALLAAGFTDVYAAADHVPVILQYKPIGVEGLDHNFVANMKKAQLFLNNLQMLPPGDGWLLIEFGGFTPEEARNSAARAMKALETAKAAVGVKMFITPEEQKKIWAVRESSFGASVFVPDTPDTFSGFEDSAVSPQKLGAYMRDLQKLYDKYGYFAVTYGHFGDGCIHSRVSFDLKTDDGIKIYRRFLEEATDLVMLYGGSFSGEHGDGQNWGEFLPKMYGPELVEAFHSFKRLWDPENKMNPGKVLAGYKADENLRLRPYETIPQPELHFSFAQDGGNFARTTERCIGIGKCLQKDEGTMCPSYKATGDEMHSTRGRAHLLHEMMRGETVRGGWQDEQVKESLDLCLACKGCKTECPVKVDVATYKAEFLSHYYQHKPRPFTAYLFGMINKWAALAQIWPAFFNFFIQTPGFKQVLLFVSGMTSKREFPLFAPQSFRKWFARRASNNAGKEVILWPDTFNNYFYPETAKKAVAVLEALGFKVSLPKKNFCCGRPLYDFGLLDQAEKYLSEILEGFRSEIESGTPVICLEPGCASVFKDELLNLFPENETAKKLSSQVVLLAEFLEKDIEKLASLKKADLSAVLHGHCHQKALTGMSAEERVMTALGLNVEILKTGCCGMAGAFGFEKKHYETSMKVAETSVIPALEKAGTGQVLTDGFSCREQLHHISGKRPFHLAEFLAQVFDLKV